MPDLEEIVVNTGPILALTAALDSLDILRMYRKVWIPQEVSQEILAGGLSGLAVSQFQAAHWLHVMKAPRTIPSMLANLLDEGEASVIQLALDRHLTTVCIDEAAGRRVARLNGLSVTGSIGVLLRAQREGHKISMQQAIANMRSKGIWLSDRVVAYALAQALDGM